MTPTLIKALADLELKPAITRRTRLLIVRRICRWLSSQRQSIRDERRILLRSAALLRSGLPFTQAAIERLEQQAGEHRATELEAIRRALVEYGILIIGDRAGMVADVDFDGLCDLLNVNTVEREQARRDGHTSLEELAFLSALEDSAERRGQDWNDAPLFNACHAALGEFIRTAAPGTLPDPFAPGGPFYGLPVQHHHPDGTVTTKRPDLVVHDARGSRVVKR
jgi:hypothetical protein